MRGQGQSHRQSASATLQEVARAAGVSLATASRAFNGSATRTVRPDLRERVLAAAAELNYTPNANAQAMARGTTNLVGLVVHDIADPFFAAIAAGVMRAADEHGLIVTMGSTQREPLREVEYVAALRQQRARVLILAGSRLVDSEIFERLGAEVSAFQAIGGQVAAISQPKLPVNTVVVGNRAGAAKLAETLHGLGYRRFAVLAGPSTLLTARDRLAGFRAGLAKHGCVVPGDRVVPGEFTRDGGYAAMSELLHRGTDVTCVFAVNDVMAVGAMAALRDHGLRLPDEMAVAGFDDIVTLRDVTPGLTTVRVPLEDLGASALRLALEPPAEKPRLQRVRGVVVVRESTPDRTR
ncbi:LacI family DNA-binding transcriptional regulator [Parafrankia elaeagni]|uniref:LacI family DNA-binding transcriptional regulator n=1 Tax=Parafrankia elaeagni TaxID=222534 RepID=UPI0003A978CB|nr:LacI family DNA-binding transcriptional regulator [Parafrankia elaeagni]